MRIPRSLITALLQTAIVIGVLLILPLMIYAFTRNFDESIHSLISIIPAMTISYVIFMLNYWWFVPVFYYKKKKFLYFSVNIFLYFLILLQAFITFSRVMNPLSENVFIFASTCFITLMFVVGSSALALALRNSLRNQALREQILEEKRRHTEDELIWLKNQINPHFLFNTLNNISALINLDTDRAQDCISRLSDLLRYAMYDTSKQYVSLAKEVDFMKDYISLMKLRCNEKTVVKSNFDVESCSVQIAPLLLISLIENAFKHGVSSNQPSEISISMVEKGSNLSFECENTNHAKRASDHSGSGIGLANMKRRLELLYSGRFQWIQNIDKDKFIIKVTIEL